MMNCLKIFLVVGLLTTSFFSLAVPVLESSAVNKAATVPAAEADAAENANAQLFVQLQALQETVMQLQGTVEQQQFEIQQLKQQVKDNYQNVDQRLADLQKPVAEVVSAEKTTANQASEAQIQNDKQAYQAAYDLITQRKFDEARNAFQAFVQQYAHSDYEANAYYWLGELYIVDGDNDKAKQAFQTILTKFTKHQKYPEALYKIATLNYDDGKKDIAKQQLNNLVAQFDQQAAYNKIVEKAKQYLQKNYP